VNLERGSRLKIILKKEFCCCCCFVVVVFFQKKKEIRKAVLLVEWENRLRATLSKSV
jgi:hypothetical protein